MAVADDLNRLTQDAVVYLTQQLTGNSLYGQEPGMLNPGSKVVYRGRLRQAINGNWVFNTSLGTNGVSGVVLDPNQGAWNTNDTPGGIEVTAVYGIFHGGPPDPNAGGVVPGLVETITLSDVIPPELAEG